MKVFQSTEGIFYYKQQACRVLLLHARITQVIYFFRNSRHLPIHRPNKGMRQKNKIARRAGTLPVNNKSMDKQEKKEN